ncbi:COG1361 S-layer family protein [Natronorubrum aibiense]|uniref:DUF11 domain-containing protein n=1 Tax=Natronorubrum aibiense TaxID=348826 RepID=A0A5P9P0X5_9EURY|nr:NEW3 domain-containing protein [Natronorubrum aibiense]QFU81782.1 DUF11 domain-containing protein [Natronorubrum aibiense]
MTREGATPQQRRRHRIAVGCLVLVLVGFCGVATPVAAASSDTATAGYLQVQEDQPGNETEVNDSAAAGDDGALPPEQRPENESPTPLPTEDVPEEFPQAPSTIDSFPVQGPEGDVIVEIDDDQSVRAGDTTTIDLEVTNDGDEDVTDVVVTFQAPDGSVTLGSPTAPQATQSVYFEELQDGETEQFDIDVTASRVDSGTYPLFATVQYRVDDDDDDDNGDDEPAETSGPSVLGIDVDDAHPLEITPVETDVPVDSDAVYEARVTNDGNETITGIVATLEVGPPLSSESPTAYVGTLESGESTAVRFGLESSSDAIETSTNVAISLTYDTGSGERTSTTPSPYPVSITDTDEETDVDSIGPFVAVAVVFVLAAIWWLRRR